jgi:Protein of unknown function (DUF3575)
MKSKLYFLCLFFSCLNLALAQTSLKFNAASGLVGFPNIGVETNLSKKYTFQIDATASLWKSVNNAPLQLFMVIPEVRYYPKEATKGFFIGAHIGGASYEFQKWNYINTDYYQKGYSVLYGITLGYQFEVSSKLNLEIFAGGGYNQGYYKGYLLSTGERYDVAKDYNKSSELIPYRGGLMLVYKLK